ncbi:DUF2924 domain-containing protein [Variibacter gotjawalensis]|uniref:DUF2924 domain-containing protein n=1 Tax=Variibacter gotjawalensis TaxID=1333996 RepID=UPI000BBA7AFE|nr:DUF2924 domain-containing protein [Variibacter gotjawalensis]NIK47687.1 hypothetical protein [Variibacter gotjawalensis]
MTEAKNSNGRSGAIASKIIALQKFSRDELKAEWRKTQKCEPPDHLTKWLLFRILAYRLQELAYGGLDRETEQYLSRVADGLEARRSGQPGKMPDAPRRLKTGTILVREYERVMHRVAVTDTGYCWGEQTFRSLSQVAFAITGTRWNGPRFFGLREKIAPRAKAQVGKRV